MCRMRNGAPSPMCLCRVFHSGVFAVKSYYRPPQVLRPCLLYVTTTAPMGFTKSFFEKSSISLPDPFSAPSAMILSTAIASIKPMHLLCCLPKNRWRALKVCLLLLLDILFPHVSDQIATSSPQQRFRPWAPSGQIVTDLVKATQVQCSGDCISRTSGSFAYQTYMG